MASTPYASRSAGAGGKIVNNRRKQRLSATPYDRPPPPPSPAPSKSPNWFSGIILPSARALASGAGKMISSVFFSESSSDSSDSEYDSAENDHEIAPDGGEQEDEFTLPRTETKRVIEQLVMHEMFSREERDRLIHILNSRVIDSSTMEHGESSQPIEPLGGSENVDLCDKAVMEAKKWFEEKKVGSAPATHLDYEFIGFSPMVSEHTEKEAGSPVDMARSYMRARPPWASPTKPNEVRTPSPLTADLLGDGSPYSIGTDSLSSSKIMNIFDVCHTKRNSLASGSWNIHEELRRVRSKATEDMLRTPPSKIDPSLLSRTPRTHPMSLRPRSTPRSASQDLDPGVRSGAGLALESMQDDAVKETLSSKPVNLSHGHNEPTDSNRAVEHHTEDSSQKSAPVDDKLMSELNGTDRPNGVASSQASQSEGAGTGQNHVLPGEENQSADDGSQSKKANTAPAQDKCELLTEAHVEVPSITKTNTIASGSQNSFNMQNDDSSQEMIQPTAKATKSDNMAGKLQGRKSGKPARRGRGKGK